MKTFKLIIIYSLILSLILVGCGKKNTIAPKSTFVDKPTSKVGFGTISGICSVCKTKSNYMLAVKCGDYNATVCSPACGSRFRAYPTYYGDHYTITKSLPAPLAKGMGSIKGTCSVCGKNANDLMAIKVDTFNGTICSPDCGGKFRANPTQYGKK